MSSADYEQGYREQAEWLREEALPLPAARAMLDARSVMLDRMDGEQSYNEGGNQATLDYIAGLAQ